MSLIALGMDDDLEPYTVEVCEYPDDVVLIFRGVRTHLMLCILVCNIVIAEL